MTSTSAALGRVSLFVCRCARLATTSTASPRCLRLSTLPRLATTEASRTRRWPRWSTLTSLERSYRPWNCTILFARWMISHNASLLTNDLLIFIILLYLSQKPSWSCLITISNTTTAVQKWRSGPRKDDQKEKVSREEQCGGYEGASWRRGPWHGSGVQQVGQREQWKG